MSSSRATRYAKSYETKDHGGGGKSAFNWQKTGRDTKTLFFKPKLDKNAIDIIPYEIKSKLHPLVKAGDLKVGQEDYVMDIYIHKSVGLNKTDVICPKKNYAKPCPICEQADQYKAAGQQKEFESLKASRRALYNVVDLREPEKGVQIFDASHYNFERELIDEARSAGGSEGFIDFADPSEKGFTVTFRAVEETFGKNKYFEFKSFNFRARQKPIAQEFMDQVISFDDLITALSYEEIQAVLYGADEPEDGVEDEDTPPPAARKAVEPNEIDDDVPASKPAVPKAASRIACPHAGGVFGRDCDEYAECSDCPHWSSCVKGGK